MDENIINAIMQRILKYLKDMDNPLDLEETEETEEPGEEYEEYYDPDEYYYNDEEEYY